MVEPTLKLNTGATIPVFGLGTSGINKGQVSRAIDIAVRAGYRSFDTAWIYQNEEEIGESLNNLFKEGVVKREDLFLMSKLWSGHNAAECVEQGCRDTLRKLKINYLDLYLIHSPFSSTKDGFPKLKKEHLVGYDPQLLAGTWKAMESLVYKGLVKAIGISNFTITKTEKLLETAKIVPAVIQVECHLYFQQPKLREYCKQKGIVFEAYAPLGSPGKKINVLFDDPLVKELAGKYNVTAAQVCISFLLHLGMRVIPKSHTESRIKENLQAMTISLTPEDIRRLVSCDKNMRLFPLTRFVKADIKLEEMWDIEADEKFSF